MAKHAFWTASFQCLGKSLFQAHFGLFDRGCLFNLEKTIVWVLLKKLEYKVEKLKYKKVGGHAAED